MTKQLCQKSTGVERGKCADCLMSELGRILEDWFLSKGIWIEDSGGIPLFCTAAMGSDTKE